MRTTLFIICYISAALSLAAQNTEQVQQGPSGTPVFISAGTHLGFWQYKGVYGIPFNIQGDVLFSKKLSLGLGYVYDEYMGQVNFLNSRIRPGNIRQNVNIRFLNYFRNPDKIFSFYIGCSLGISMWNLHPGTEFYPSTQFLFGLRLKIFKDFFWLNEFGVGPPFLFQSSVGVKF